MLVSATDLAARTTSLRSPDFDQANPQKRNCISTDGSTTSEHASKTISLEKKNTLEKSNHELTVLCIVERCLR